jgi:hypothetical protein
MCGLPFLEQVQPGPERAADIGPQAREGQAALAAAFLARGPGTAPFKWGRRILVPGLGHCLQAGDDLL